MNDLFLLSVAQMRRTKPYFPISHGVPRVDDRRIIGGTVFVIRNELRWRDALRDYPPEARHQQCDIFQMEVEIWRA